MRTIRRWIYELGGRPRPGSIWYSPSMSWIYSFRDADIAAAFKRGLERNSQ